MMLLLIEKWLGECHPGFRVYHPTAGLLSINSYNHRIDLMQPFGTTDLNLVTYLRYDPNKIKITGYHPMSAADPDFFDRLDAILCEINGSE